jgi:UbiD family decarboxylase
MTARRHPGDLRAWLDDVEPKGLVKHISGADPHLEIGIITEINNAEPEPSALLFDEIPGSIGRVLTCSASRVETMAAALGLEAATNADLIKQLRGGRFSQWIAKARTDRFAWVDDGPVMENRMMGPAVDLDVLPAPFWREGDGGKYIGTGGVVITQDPETLECNAGAYRVMSVDKNHVTVLFASESRHGRQHKRKYETLGKRCPIVVSLGHDPLFMILGGTEIPEGVFELDVAGAILGTPARMVKGPITGLPIPADAEIVLEGWLTDDETHEGPFGEFLGYYASGERQQPIIDVEAVYYRNEPIVLGSPPGKPPNDLSYYWSVIRSATIHDQMEGAGVPGITAVWADQVGGSRQLITVAIKQRYFGHSRQAGFIASQCHGGVYLGRYVVVVDDDISPYDLREVMWAVVTRSDPQRDIIVFDKSLGSQADPLNVLYDPNTMFSSRAIIDACRPYQHLDKFPKVAVSPQNQIDATRAKWAHLWRSPE